MPFFRQTLSGLRNQVSPSVPNVAFGNVGLEGETASRLHSPNRSRRASATAYLI